MDTRRRHRTRRRAARIPTAGAARVAGRGYPSPVAPTRVGRSAVAGRHGRAVGVGRLQSTLRPRWRIACCSSGWIMSRPDCVPTAQRGRHRPSFADEGQVITVFLNPSAGGTATDRPALVADLFAAAGAAVRFVMLGPTTDTA